MNVKLNFNVKGKVIQVPDSKQKWNYYNYPAYRFYINDNLITERSWIWVENDQYLTEQMFLDLNPGTHIISFETLHRMNFDKKYDPIGSDYNKRYSLFFDVDEIKINNNLINIKKTYTKENKTNFDLEFVLE